MAQDAVMGCIETERFAGRKFNMSKRIKGENLYHECFTYDEQNKIVFLVRVMQFVTC